MVLDVSPVETHGRASLQFPPHISTFFPGRKGTQNKQKNPPEPSEGFSVNRMETIR